MCLYTLYSQNLSFHLLSPFQLLKKFQIVVSRFDVSSIPVFITLQRFRQILKEHICNLYYTDEDQKSETIVYSYEVMEKILI